jgi:hypothetical protein
MPSAPGATTSQPCPAALHSEHIKLTTLRSNTAIAVLTGLIGLFATWATAALVTDEV